MLCMSLFCFACDEPEDPTPPSTDPAITLNKTSASMVVGDYEQLTYALTNEADGFSVAWSTSNDAIATVENGKIEAINVGKANIVATYSNGTDSYTSTCEVEVGWGNSLPKLFIDNRSFDDNNWNVIIGSIVDLKPYVMFNGRRFDDVQITLSSQNNNYVSVEGSKFTAVALGDSVVTITGTWRGTQLTQLMTTTINVSVVEDFMMSLNGNAVDNVQLYTRSSWGGVDYDTSIDFVLQSKLNGVVQSTPVMVTVGDNSIVSYSNGELTANKFGTTDITLSWSSPNGRDYIKVIQAEVIRPLKVVNTIITQFSSKDGYFLNEGNVPYTLVDVAYDGMATPSRLFDASQEYFDIASGRTVVESVDVEGFLVKNIYSHGSGYQDVYVTIGTETEQTAFHVKSATKIYTQDNAPSLYGDLNAPNDDGRTVIRGVSYGYYALAEDIYGIEIGYLSTGKFAGTFDGQGHTINNVKVAGEYGLFGNLTIGADTSFVTTVKNVGFKNVEFTSSTGNYVLAKEVGKANSRTVALKDIYVSVKPQATLIDNSAPLFKTAYSVSGENIFVEYPFASAVTPTTNYGSLFTAHVNYLNAGKFINTYVISPVQLSKNNVGSDQFTNIDAGNIDGFDPAADEGIKATDVKRYTDVASMKADSANNTFSSFSSANWTVIDGVPTWNTTENCVFVKNSSQEAVTSMVAYLPSSSDEATFTVGIKTPNGELDASELIIQAFSYYGDVSSLISISGKTVTLKSGHYSAYVVVSNLEMTLFDLIKVSVTNKTPVNVVDDVIIGKTNGKLYLNGTALANETILSVIYENKHEILTDNGYVDYSIINKAVGTETFSLLVGTTDNLYSLTNVRLVDAAFDNSKESRIALATLLSAYDKVGALNDAKSYAPRKVTGYYALADNITFDTCLEEAIVNNDFISGDDHRYITFAGTFDGRGFGLNNVQLGSTAGIFGMAGDGAVIKNLMISDAYGYDVTTGASTKNAVGTVLFSAPESTTASVLVDNVYVYYSPVLKTGIGPLLYRRPYATALVNGSTVTNIASTEADYGETIVRNSIFENKTLKTSAAQWDYAPLLVGGLLANSEPSAVDVYTKPNGITFDKSYLITDTGISGYKVAIWEGVTTYKDVNALKEANQDYTGFNENYWNIASGEVPVFNAIYNSIVLKNSSEEPINNIYVTTPGESFTVEASNGRTGAIRVQLELVDVVGNANYSINEGTITFSEGVLSAKLIAKDVYGNELKSYMVGVDTRIPVEKTFEVLVDKDAKSILLEGTEFEGETLTSVKYNGLELLKQDGSLDFDSVDVPSGAATIQIEVDNVLYSLTNAKVCDMVFENTRESRIKFATLFSARAVKSPDGNTTYREAKTNNETSLTITGYYALAENITFNIGDATSGWVTEEAINNGMGSGANAVIFKGTFDGRGYSLNDIPLYCDSANNINGNYGIFGTAGDGSVIKNVAFNQFYYFHEGTYSYKATKSSAESIVCDNAFNTIGGSALFYRPESVTASITLENVYLYTNRSGYYNNVQVGVIFRDVISTTAEDALGALTIRNSYFEVDTNIDQDYTAMIVGAGTYMSANISAKPASVTIDNAYFVSTSSYNNIPIFMARGGANWDGVNKYFGKAKLAEAYAGSDYEYGLSETYWSVDESTNTPIFNALYDRAYLKTSLDVGITTITEPGTYYAGYENVINGDYDNVTLEVENGSDKVTINGNQIVVEMGEYDINATLKVKWNDKVVATYSIAFSNRVATQVENVIISKTSGKVFVNGTELVGKTITSISLNSEDIQIDDTNFVDTDKLPEIVGNAPSSITALIVETSDGGLYSLNNVMVATDVFENTRESRIALASMLSARAVNNPDGTANRAGVGDKTITGYYTLVENITFNRGTEGAWVTEEAIHNGPGAGANAVKFDATFDGRGFALNDILLYCGGSSGYGRAWGMFGVACDGAVIKNIAFNQFYYFHEGTYNYYATKSDYDSNPIACSNSVNTVGGSALFYKPESATASITLDNVYFYTNRYGLEAKICSGIIFRDAFSSNAEEALGALTITNSYFEVDTNIDQDYTAMFVGQGAYTSANITSKPTSVTIQNTYFVSTSAYANNPIYMARGGSAWAGVGSYCGKTALANAYVGVSYNYNLSTSYWSVGADNTPAWNSLVG